MPPHAVRPAAAASAPSPPRHLERRGFCHFPWTGGGAPPERLSWKKNWKISRRSATSARATRRCPAPSCLQRGFDFLRGPAGGIPSFSSERSAWAGDRDGQPNVGLRAGGGAGRRAAGRWGRRRYRTGAVRPCRSLPRHLVVVVGALQGADHGAFFCVEDADGGSAGGRCRSLFSVALLEVWTTSPHPAPRRPGRPRGPQWDIQAPCAPPASLMPAPITSQKHRRLAGGGQGPRVVRQCSRCGGGEQRHRQRAQVGGQPDGPLLGRAKPRRETGTGPRRRRSTHGKEQHTGSANCRDDSIF